MKPYLRAVLALAVVFAPLPAGALTFTFSMKADPAYSNSPGPITGQILGLRDNATSAATDIIVTGEPANFFGGSTPFDVFAYPGTSIWSNSFTISNGQMTQASFLEEKGGYGILYLNYGGYNDFQLPGSAVVGNFQGLSGLGIAASVPEPASVTILLASGLALDFIRRGRRTLKAASAVNRQPPVPRIRLVRAPRSAE